MAEENGLEVDVDHFRQLKGAASVGHNLYSFNSLVFPETVNIIKVQVVLNSCLLCILINC